MAEKPEGGTQQPGTAFPLWGTWAPKPKGRDVITPYSGGGFMEAI